MWIPSPRWRKSVRELALALNISRVDRSADADGRSREVGIGAVRSSLPVREFHDVQANHWAAPPKQDSQPVEIAVGWTGLESGKFVEFAAIRAGLPSG
jgi:hypothetical protein